MWTTFGRFWKYAWHHVSPAGDVGELMPRLFLPFLPRLPSRVVQSCYGGAAISFVLPTGGRSAATRPRRFRRPREPTPNPPCGRRPTAMRNRRAPGVPPCHVCTAVARCCGVNPLFRSFEVRESHPMGNIIVQFPAMAECPVARSPSWSIAGALTGGLCVSGRGRQASGGER